MMVIVQAGAIEGSLTGGCVEGAVVTEAESLLAGERGPGVLVYGISDELAGTVGLMCGGTVHIFLQEISDPIAEIELGVLEAHGAGRTAAVATLLDGPEAGARMSVIDDVVVGSMGRQALLDRHDGREAGGVVQEGPARDRRFGSR